MKNLGSILLLLATSATYVASIPYGEPHQYEVRGYGDEPASLFARVPKKKNKNNGNAAAAANATVDAGVTANGTADAGKGVCRKDFPNLRLIGQ